MNNFWPYLSSVLKGEEASFISEPMHEKCRLAVLIPVYNESFDMLLRLLLSLALQEKIRPEEFETVLIINNGRQEALDKTESFLANQKAISFIKYINKTAPRPAGLQAHHQKKIRDIQNSRIKIHVLDKSSKPFAYEENNVGFARNRAGAEICQRFFKNGRGEKGIIALLDCDTRVSQNFIKEIVRSFDKHNLNGVAGNFIHEHDPAEPYAELIQKVYQFALKKVLNFPVISRAKRWYLKKRDRIPIQLLMSGQNMAVSAGAWAKAGGMPKCYFLEDTIFGGLVEALPGEVAYNSGYTVYPLSRPSERVAGWSSMGRGVTSVKKYALDYLEGRTTRILVPDKKKIAGLLGSLFKSQQTGSLSGRHLGELLVWHDCLPHPHSANDLQQMAEILVRDFVEPDRHRTFKTTNDVISEKISPYFPVLDATTELKVLFKKHKK